jgi:predicted dehydrogenase
MRFGLVGCGWIVERCHAPSMARADGVEVVAVADPSPGRADLVGDLFGLDSAARYTNYRELLARDDIDVISVGTPPTTHREIVEAAADRGVHVLCEKPLALNLADCDAMLEAAERAGVKLAVYHNYLWYTSTLKLLELIDAGAIGDVISTDIRGLGLRPWVGNDAYRPGWRFSVDEGGGGALMDAGLHALYLTEALHGSTPVAATASMQYERPGVDASALCQLQMASGGAATVEIGWQHGDGGITVYGTEGFLRVVLDEQVGYYGYPARAVREFSAGAPQTGASKAHYLPLEFNMMEPQLYRDLVGSLEGGKAVYPAFGADGRRAIETALALYAGAARRSWIEVPIAEDDAVYARGVGALV